MAKRRMLEVPSSDALQRMEEEFRRETPGGRGPVAPIAQVAADAAGVFDPRPAADRAEAARDRADAQALRAAQGRGLVLLDLPLDEIDADALVRDRVALNPEEMAELKGSIAQNGMRLPVEVFLRPGEGTPYGLLSGYRRLMALRALRAATGDSRYDRVRAILREPAAMGGSFAAMVEENEIRASLSHYERGRIAVIAAQQGAFAGVEAAVDALFPMASKAKRSKIRSFALIFEELGDMLKFPDQITEKAGLRLASALRDGGEAAVRAALAQQDAASAEDEAAQIDRALARQAPAPPDPRRGGRPRRLEGPVVRLASGHVLQAVQEGEGWIIRLSGAPVTAAFLADVMGALEMVMDSR